MRRLPSEGRSPGLPDLPDLSDQERVLFMRKWWPLAAVCLGAFMLLVDVTIVNVALPAMADDLDASFSSLQWVVDAYALALAAVLLVSGSLADHLGHRRVYLLGLVLFAAASAVCGFAPTAGTVVAARLVQGVGGAAMFAASPALLLSCYQGRDRSTAFGVWGAVNGAAAAVGPVLGGLLTQHLGWRWIFWVNLPVALAALAATRCLVPPSASRRTGTRTDLPGAAAFTAAAAGLTYGLIRVGDTGWTSVQAVVPLVVAAVCAGLFVVVEVSVVRRGGTPMLDVSLLRRPAFGSLMTGALLMQGAAFGSMFLMSVWLQSVLHLSPVTAGLALTPMAGAVFVVSPLVSRWVHQVPPRLPIGLGLLLIAAGMALLAAQTGPQAGAAALAPGLLVCGVGVGLAMPVLVSAATTSVPPHRAGMASGTVNTFRQLGTSLAIAVYGAVFTARAAHGLTAAHPADGTRAAASALAGGRSDSLVAAAGTGRRAAAQEAVHAAFANGLHSVFLWSAAAAAVGGVLVLALLRTTAQPTHHKTTASATTGTRTVP